MPSNYETQAFRHWEKMAPDPEGIKFIRDHHLRVVNFHNQLIPKKPYAVVSDLEPYGLYYNPGTSFVIKTGRYDARHHPEGAVHLLLGSFGAYERLRNAPRNYSIFQLKPGEPVTILLNSLGWWNVLRSMEKRIPGSVDWNGMMAPVVDFESVYLRNSFAQLRNELNDIRVRKPEYLAGEAVTMYRGMATCHLNNILNHVVSREKIGIPKNQDYIDSEQKLADSNLEKASAIETVMKSFPEEADTISPAASKDSPPIEFHSFLDD
jgi:hypothetical protein